MSSLVVTASLMRLDACSTGVHMQVTTQVDAVETSQACSTIATI